jgi:hypothetical protein
MPNERTPKKPREQYRLRTRLIHGSFATGRWEYDHHVVPPQCRPATSVFRRFTAARKAS